MTENQWQKRRSGRPALPSNLRRRRMTIRVSLSELDRIEQSRPKGEPLGTYMRRMILEGSSRREDSGA